MAQARRRSIASCRGDIGGEAGREAGAAGAPFAGATATRLALVRSAL